MHYYLDVGGRRFRVQHSLAARPSWRRCAWAGDAGVAAVRHLSRVVVTAVEPGEPLGGPHFGPWVEGLLEIRDRWGVEGVPETARNMVEALCKSI